MIKKSLHPQETPVTNFFFFFRWNRSHPSLPFYLFTNHEGPFEILLLLCPFSVLGKDRKIFRTENSVLSTSVNKYCWLQFFLSDITDVLASFSFLRRYILKVVMTLRRGRPGRQTPSPTYIGLPFTLCQGWSRPEVAVKMSLCVVLSHLLVRDKVLPPTLWGPSPVTRRGRVLTQDVRHLRNHPWISQPPPPPFTSSRTHRG